jgi:Flp pilus assembly protein TadB
MMEGKTRVAGRMQEVKMKDHVLSSYDAQMIRFPGVDRAGRKIRKIAHRDTTLDGIHRKPAWHVLYIAVALAILLFVVAEIESPVGGWGILAQCLGTALIIGVMALWVRTNRTALAFAAAVQYGERSPEGSLVYSPRRSSVPRLDSRAIEFNQRSRSRTRPAEEEHAKCLLK